MRTVKWGFVALLLFAPWTTYSGLLLRSLDYAVAGDGLLSYDSASGQVLPPVVTLKVNGLHPTSAVVAATGPAAISASVSPTIYTGTLAWYWAYVYNAALYWVTPAGLSTSPAPFHISPPLVLNDLLLASVTLPLGSSMTNVFFLVGTGGTVVASDFITICTAPPVMPAGFVLGWQTGLPGWVQMDWKASTGVVTSYTLEFGTTPGATDVRVVDTGSAATSQAFIDFAPGLYYARVRATSPCGVSGPSNVASFRVS